MATSARIPWIDNAKAVGNRAGGAGARAGAAGGAAGIPLSLSPAALFFLAGAVVKPERLAEGFFPWVKRQARSLLVPYLFFWGVSTVWWLVIRNIGEKAKESVGLAWWSPVQGLFWGTGEALFVNPPLWFFPAMFVTATTVWGMWWLTRWEWRRLGITLAGLALVIFLLPGIGSRTLWWNVDLVPWAVGGRKQERGTR